MVRKISKDKWEGVKFRKLPDYNYSVVWNNLTTIRFDEGDVIELPAWLSEFYDVSLGNCCRTGKCQFCFPESFLVKTENGYKKIQDIRIGDHIYSMNHSTNNIEIQTVSQTFKREYMGNLICIELDNGDIIKCTPNHQIYTQNRGYIAAEDLTENDILLNI